MAESSEGVSKSPKVQVFDLPDLSEIFADHVKLIVFDGQTLRLDFGVTRSTEGENGSVTAVSRYPVCRLALSPSGAVDLFNHMQRILSALVSAGIIKPDSISENAQKTGQI